MKVEIFLVLNQPLHPKLISLLVALCPGSLNTRTLASIQHAELDTRGIGVECHDATKGIDLPHHMTLGQTADRGVA